MLTDSLVEAFRTRLEMLGFRSRRPSSAARSTRSFKSESLLRLGGERCSEEDCTRASRALEEWLDAGGPLGTRYVLEVSSPGIERPLKWHRHWVRFVGRDINAKLAGLGRVRARIVAVPTEETVVLQPQGGPEQEYRLADVRDARLTADD
jgi:ribosome maturation factor RimP